MNYPQLPESEFSVMQVIWEHSAEISGSMVTKLLESSKKWKHQTVSTLLNRLVEKGFLSSEKRGKERYYKPLVDIEPYLRQETGRFVEAFHKNSLTGLMSALVSNTDIDDEELSELSAWLENRAGGAKNDG